MKKSVKLLILGLMFIVGFNEVKAIDFSEGASFSIVKDGTVTADGLRYGNYTYNGEIKYHSSVNGKDYVTYCEDPHLQGGGSYTVDRILGADSQHDEVNSYDHGILAILANGYNQFNSSLTLDNGTVVSGNDLYLATSLAQRAFTMGLYGWGGNATLSAAYQAKGSSLINLGVHWATIYSGMGATEIVPGLNSCTTNDQACIQRYIAGKYGSWYDPNIVMIYGAEGSTSYNVIYAAQKLFRLGVEAASDYYRNKNLAFSIDARVGDTESVEQNETTATEYVYINMEVNNIAAEDGYINNVQLDCPQCNANGITIESIEYSTETTDWATLDASTDISKALPTGSLTGTQDKRSGIIRIRILVSKDLTIEECTAADFTLSYDYHDTSVEYYGALLRPSTTNTQRFFVVAKADEEGGAQTGEVSGRITCAEQSEICETVIEVPVCSDDEEDAVANVYTSEEIKKCILNNTDEAQNSYLLSEENGGVNSDNEFCSVYCKEDYISWTDNEEALGGITLDPIISDVNCGTNFKLTARVEGKKDCYTAGTVDDMGIDIEKYLDEIESAQSRMVDAMNRWYMYTAMAAHDYEDEETDFSCGGDTCGTRLSIDVEWEEYDEVTFEWDENSGNGSYEYGTHEGGSNGWSDDCECSTCGAEPNTYSCCGGCDNGASEGYSDWLSDIAEGLAEAEDDLEEAYEDYQKLITDLNACTGMWENVYQFNQKIKYFYNEFRGEDEPMFTTYYDLLKQSSITDADYLIPIEDEFEYESEIEVCYETADDKYVCEGASDVFDMTGETDSDDPTEAGNITEEVQDIDEWNYASNVSGAYETRNYVTCFAGEGCSDDKRDISQARFIRKTVKKAQSYETPTVFYQIAANGKITIVNDYAGDKLQLEALENVLPVSTSVVGGGIYQLLIEDLGEFYDDGELGRLIDVVRLDVNPDGTTEIEINDESVAYAKGIDEETFDGNYLCYYESDCRSPECPNCDFECDEDGCEWVDCPECVFDCVNCIFNLDELDINVKPIISTDVNSVDRQPGYNWTTAEDWTNWNITTSMAPLQLLVDKAEATIDEIETENEMIYDKTGDDSSLAFSIRLTSDLINELKSINASAEGSGGYANDTLTCYDATLEDGTVVPDIYCYSEVIDELIADYGDDITVYNRTPVGSRSDDNDAANADGYWTLWSTWEMPTLQENSGALTVIGGPSWK